MATRSNAVDSSNFTTAFTTIAAGDDLIAGHEFKQAWTAGLAISASDLNSIQILPGCEQNIGAANNPLITVVNNGGAGKVTIAGSGTFYYITSTGPTGVIKRLDFDPVKPATLSLDACDCDALIVRGGGGVTVGLTCDLAVLEAGGNNKVTLTTTATYPITTLSASGRTEVDVGRDCTTCDIRDDAVVNAIDKTFSPGTVNIRDRAVLKGQLGNLGTVNLYGGTLDLTKVPVAPTWTAVNTFGPHKVLISRSGPAITVPAPTTEYWKLNVVYVP